MPSPRSGARLLLAAGLSLLAVVAGCTAPDDRPTPRVSTPAPTPTIDERALAAEAAALTAKLSDEQLVGQVLVPSVNLGDPVEQSVALLKRYHLGGLVLMGNVEDTTATGTADQVRALTAALRDAAHADGQPVAPILATDQEYGWVTRIRSGVVQLPAAMTFGAAARPDLTTAAWRGAGAELAAVGITVDLAPDADVVTSPGNTVIGSRSYGGNAALVASQVAAAVTGLQSTGVAATLKHFPGHGRTTVNSHDALPVIGGTVARWRAEDLPPFQAGIAAGAWLVMSGHLDVTAIDPGVPASFSHKALVDVLRGQLGFTGVTVTDALNMEPAMVWSPGESAVRAFLAGNDLLLMSPDLGAARQGLLDALDSGRIPRARMTEAVTRILTLKLRSSRFSHPALSTADRAAHQAAALAVAQAAVTVLKGPCTGPLVTGPVRVTTSDGRAQQATWLTAALKAQGIPVVTSGGTVVHLIGYLDSHGDLSDEAAVTVAMDSPFLLREATSRVRVATYSSTQVAMQALAAVIAGKAQAPGHTPVAVTGLPSSACSG